ncbi:MAG TPA: hypothetical protein VJW77_13465, partial [Terriglobia bacterium]|nr:hypothetical protein [Terriglobia bacterium]
MANIADLELAGPASRLRKRLELYHPPQRRRARRSIVSNLFYIPHIKPLHDDSRPLVAGVGNGQF